MWPSTPPENTTPGIAVTAADCAGLQPGLTQPGCGVCQAIPPVSIFSAVRPPPTFGSNSYGTPKTESRPATDPGGAARLRTSDSATYTFFASAADPHCTPPRLPPWPTRTCQRSLPS